MQPVRCGRRGPSPFQCGWSRTVDHGGQVTQLQSKWLCFSCGVLFKCSRQTSSCGHLPWHWLFAHPHSTSGNCWIKNSAWLQLGTNAFLTSQCHVHSSTNTCISSYTWVLLDNNRLKFRNICSKSDHHQSKFRYNCPLNSSMLAFTFDRFCVFGTLICSCYIDA